MGMGGVASFYFQYNIYDLNMSKTLKRNIYKTHSKKIMKKHIKAYILGISRSRGGRFKGGTIEYLDKLIKIFQWF